MVLVVVLLHILLQMVAVVGPGDVSAAAMLLPGRVVTAVALVGCAFRNFGDFLSLMGWFAFGVQGFLAPAAMHLVLFRYEAAPSTRERPMSPSLTPPRPPMPSPPGDAVSWPPG